MKYSSSGIQSFGGKFRALKILLPLFPRIASKRTFVDLFAGSGVVSLNYNNYNTILNDKYDYIFSYFEVLGGAKFPVGHERRKLYEQFILEMETVVRGPAWVEKYEKRKDIVGKTIYFIILNKNNYGAIVETNRENPFDFSVPQLNKLHNYEHMVHFFKNRDVRVWNKDFRDVLKRVNKWSETERQEIFIYADPPYLDAQRYQIKFEKEDLSDLADLLLESQHHWMMSNEDTPIVSELFEGCHFKRVGWQYNTNPRSAKEITEVLVSNREIKERNLSFFRMDEWINT